MSTKTVAEKLFLKPGSTLWLSDPSRASLIDPLPDGVSRVGEPDQAGAAIVFAESAAAVRATLDTYREQLTRQTNLWVAYPKGGRADINRDSLWPILADHGMRPNAQVALDDVWSALRFRADREGEERFTGGR
jgi:hypothetical protein